MNNKIDFQNKVLEIENNSEFKIINLSACNFLMNSGVITLNKGKDCFFLTDFSYPMFLNRVGLGCPTLNSDSFINKNQQLLTQLVNETLSIDTQNPKFAMGYFRDNEVLALHSKDYKPLLISELVNKMETVLSNNYDKVEFLSASVSDEFTFVDYGIEDRNVVNAYEKFVCEGGKFYDSQIIVRLVTSHLGMSGANIYPIFKYRTSENTNFISIPLTEKQITLKHEGKASIELFGKNVEQIFPLIEMLPDQLNLLKNIKINYPTHTVINLAEKVGIPAKRVTPVAEDISFLYNGCTPSAKDIVLQLANVVEYGTTDAEKVQLLEKVGKAIRILREHKDEVDIPKTKWKRLGVLCNEGQDFIPDDFGPQLTFVDVGVA